MSRFEVSADGRAARLAAQNRSVLSVEQLLACGLSRDAIAHRVQHGRAHRMFRGVYLWGVPAAPPLAWETAALLAGGPHSCLSHFAVLALDGLLPHSRPVHITSPSRRRAQRNLRPHTSTLAPRELTLKQGLRTTTTARALRDLRSLMDPDHHDRLTHEAEVKGLIPPRAGPGVTKQELERRLLQLLRRAGLPPDATNVRIQGHEVDALYRDAKLVLEADGYATHRTRRKFESDRARDAALLAAGYRVMRITWRQVTQEPEALVVRIARALASH